MLSKNQLVEALTAATREIYEKRIERERLREEERQREIDLAISQIPDSPTKEIFFSDTVICNGSPEYACACIDCRIKVHKTQSALRELCKNDSDEDGWTR
jgi:hypothetical protein